MSNRVISSRLLEDFWARLRAEERAQSTIEKYQRDILSFCRYLEGQAVSKERAVGWKERLLRAGLSPATINAKLSAVNGLFRFLGWEDCRLRFFRVQRRLFRQPEKELTQQEYRRLTKAARASGQLRLELLMQALCATGVRVSELRYLTVEAAKRGRADIALKGKIRTILLPRKLCRKLLQYAQERQIVSGEIFLTKSGTSLSRRQIWREMKSLCRAAEVEASKVFPHNLRHLFAIVFYQNFNDIVRLADVLGHSSIDTTRIYLLTGGDELARQIERLKLVT
jgi:site-specific recombinase XerD